MHQSKKILSSLLILAILAVLTIPVCWLLWSMLAGSLMPLDELNTTVKPALLAGDEYASLLLLAKYPTLQPLIELLLDSAEFFVMFWNSFKITISSVLGQAIAATPAAWALSKLRFRGRKLLFGVYIILMLMPFQVTMVPNYIIIKALNIMDTHWALILPSAFSAFPVFIMTIGFNNIPDAVLEAANVDGAGRMKAFLTIGLPLGLPGILSALILGFLDAWNAIEQPMLFLKSPNKWPLSLYLEQISTDNLGIAMAASLLTLAPAALVFLFGQKYLILGIQSSGLKE